MDIMARKLWKYIVTEEFRYLTSTKSNPFLVVWFLYSLLQYLQISLFPDFSLNVSRIESLNPPIPWVEYIIHKPVQPKTTKMSILIFIQAQVCFCSVFFTITSIISELQTATPKKNSLIGPLERKFMPFSKS